MGEGLSSADVLRTAAPAAGLRQEVVPFDSVGTLRERLSANPFLMAPMAGVSDAAYRLMARAGGAALAYTEMVSVAGIHYEGAKTWELVIPDEAEPDIAVQLFGSDPEQFREATAAVVERLGDRLSLIDVNMACPVPKVTRKGEGSALLDEPDRAAGIIRSCRAETSTPVTAKIRLGRVPDRIVAPEFARVLEQAGADAVAVHGRTASQLYRGTADWRAVSDVADAVDVPVIGSGDVLSPEEALGMIRETGVCAVFVARGSYGDPWLFDDARRLLAGGSSPTRPTQERRLAAFVCHVRLLDSTHAHLARARSLAGWYLKGFPNAGFWRNKAMSCMSLEDYLALADEVGESILP